MSEALGRFDTVVMFGNNFGLFGGAAKARRMLRRLHRLTNDGARIIAESRGVYETKDPEHLGYHERNRRRGRMAGQLRIRIRHRSYTTHGSTTSSSRARRWRDWSPTRVGGSRAFSRAKTACMRP